MRSVWSIRTAEGMQDKVKWLLTVKLQTMSFITLLATDIFVWLVQFYAVCRYSLFRSTVELWYPCGHVSLLRTGGHRTPDAEILGLEALPHPATTC